MATSDVTFPIEPKYAMRADGRIINRQSREPIADGEPLFVFRAQDGRLPTVLARYLIDCADPTHKLAIAKRLVQVLEWQVANLSRVREPDTTIDGNWD